MSRQKLNTLILDDKRPKVHCENEVFRPRALDVFAACDDRSPEMTKKNRARRPRAISESAGYPAKPPVAPLYLGLQAGNELNP